MGTTHVTVEISNLTKTKTPYQAEFLVDTGAIDCFAPAARLVEAGIEQEEKKSTNWRMGKWLNIPMGLPE